jgi:FkbM family methyltransferase
MQFDNAAGIINLKSILGITLLDQLEIQPDEPKATVADILACFRLILGRSPSPEELTGHLMGAGNDLKDVVSNYLNSLEFERRHLFKRKSEEDVKLVRLKDFCIYTPTSDEAVGRHVAAGSYDTHIESTIRQCLRPGMGVMDVGANIGVYSLLAASVVGPTGYVLAVEPNPNNVKLLEASRMENSFDHLFICQAAATAKMEILALHSFGSNGTATVTDKDSIMSTLTVSGLPIDKVVKDNQEINLIKIDIEGGEYKALLGLSSTISKYRPTIISEFSPGQINMVSEVSPETYLEFFQKFGYKLGVIERNGDFKFGQGIEAIQSAYVDSGVDHIDIIAAI